MTASLKICAVAMARILSKSCEHAAQYVQMSDVDPKPKYTTDRYGRTVADVTLQDGRSLTHELIKSGACWWFRKYAPGDTVLEGLEREARAGRKGLWADPQPVPPWEWRKLRRL